MCVTKGKTLRGRTWNLSQGGMQVEVDSLKADESAQLAFTLPRCQAVIDAVGTVVWVKNDRQGIRFTKVTSTIQREIDRFIEDIEPSLK
jgi:c-di-GMP-binding flagellar brake protein YcgR